MSSTQHNFRINTVDTQAFFNIPDLLAPVVNPVILNHVAAPVGSQLPRDLRVFFRYLHDTTRDVETWLDDFSSTS